MSGSLDPEQWFQALKKRRLEIMENCFNSPPGDFSGFQRCLGEFQENALTTQVLTNLVKGLEDDD